MKEKIKIVIKVKGDKVCTSCTGNAEPSSVMAAITQALVNIGKQLDYSIDEIIKALNEYRKDEKAKKIKKESEEN